MVPLHVLLNAYKLLYLLTSEISVCCGHQSTEKSLV